MATTAHPHPDRRGSSPETAVSSSRISGRMRTTAARGLEGAGLGVFGQSTALGKVAGMEARRRAVRGADARRGDGDLLHGGELLRAQRPRLGDGGCLVEVQVGVAGAHLLRVRHGDRGEDTGLVARGGDGLGEIARGVVAIGRALRERAEHHGLEGRRDSAAPRSARGEGGASRRCAVMVSIAVCRRKGGWPTTIS